MNLTLIFLVITLFVSCASYTCYEIKCNPTKGNVTDNSYCEPNGLFKFDIPSTHNGIIEEDSKDGAGTIVGFHDDSGSFWEITSVGLGAVNENVCLNIEFYKDIFFGAFKKLKDIFPGTKIYCHSSKVIGTSEKAFFGILDIPKGGTLMNCDNKIRADAKRSYLIFSKNNKIFCLSYQKTYLDKNELEGKSIDDVILDFSEKTIDMYERMHLDE